MVKYLIFLKFGILLILCFKKSSAQEKLCKVGEEFKSCASACEPKCSDKEITACIDMCMEGTCQCIEGYARDENNKCIPKEKCPKPTNATDAPDYGCKEGEEFYSCASACEPNCTNTDVVCILRCMPGKCQCKRGYVRDANNVCIPKDKCPKLTTGIPPLQRFCCNPLQSCRKCPTGHYCIGRPGARKCVPIIPKPKCRQGEEYRDCATACEPQCGEKPKMCPAVCLKARCQCKPGYARTKCGNCVPINECPQSPDATTPIPPTTTPLICGEGEEARNCPVCEATCTISHPICPLFCPIWQRCLCKQGYARVAKGKCIPFEQCPEESTVSLLSSPIQKACNLNCIIGDECKIIDGTPTCVPIPTTTKPCVLPCPFGSVCKIENGKPTCVKPKSCDRLNCGIAYTCKIINGEATCVPLYPIKSTTEIYDDE